MNQYDRIDGLVNNAGYAALGAIEELSDEEIRRQFETNCFGVLNVTCAVLPTMREQRSGHILNISSSLGVASLSGAGIYSATKFAVEGISEALAQEVKPLGINVTLIEPGSFRTNGAASLITSKHPIADYAATSGKMMGRLLPSTLAGSGSNSRSIGNVFAIALHCAWVTGYFPIKKGCRVTGC